MNIEINKYVIVRGTDEILCGTSNNHVFKKINNIGKINILIYSSFGKAYGVIRRCKYLGCGARVIQVKVKLSEE